MLFFQLVLLAGTSILPTRQNPSWRLLGLLALTVGMPYFLLSTTSPLLQAWHARSRKGAMPYRFFALSNLTSMLALLSHPPLVEVGIWT